MALTGYERLLRHNQKRKQIRDLANDIVETKIRRITMRDKILYNSLFSYPVVKEFSQREKRHPYAIIFLMLFDMHPTVNFQLAKLWGLWKSKQAFYNLAHHLVLADYITGVGLKSGRKYYINMKGKNLIKEFGIYYDEYVEKLIRSTGDKDYESIRKVTRRTPARIYKLRNSTPISKPKVSNGGKSTDSST